MKKIRQTATQIVGMLREAEALLSAGQQASEVCRHLGISESTFYRWRAEYTGIPVDQVKRVRELEAENRRLKQVVAEQALDINILREGGAGKLLSPERRRAAVTHVQEALGLSERRACRTLGQARSSQRWVSRRAERDRALVKRMGQLARQNPTYGYRFIWALLRREGVAVNVKRVHRLWQQAGLKVVRAKGERERTGTGRNGCSIRRAERPNDVWSYDFVHDETSDGRKLKILVVVDEFTRVCLRIEVGRSMTAKTVVRVLAELVQIHGEPRAIRSDNGSEFTAGAVKEWLGAAGIRTLYIEPGSPWENGYCESFNSRLRAELLDRELFRTLIEAQVLTERHRLRHNHERPHSSLDYKTPAEFATSWNGEASAPTALRPHPSTVDTDAGTVATLTALP